MGAPSGADPIDISYFRFSAHERAEGIDRERTGVARTMIHCPNNLLELFV